MARVGIKERRQMGQAPSLALPVSYHLSRQSLWYMCEHGSFTHPLVAWKL
jgi:hypothetical protein